MGRRDEILARLDIAAFYRRELQGEEMRGHGDEVQVLCPFHEDRNPSLSINLKTGLYNCFGCGASGDVFSFYQRLRACDFREAMEELGRQAGVMEGGGGQSISGYLSLTLKEFALAKRLPDDFLRKQGVGEGRFPDGVVATDFQYRDVSGEVLAVRHRFANRGEKKFRWRKGDKVNLYGLWHWPRIMELGWLLLVEGETDCLTCWLHRVPALGLPGKKTWKRCRMALGPERLAELAGLQVFLWQEPDARDLPGEVAADLPGLQVIPAPDGIKDLSEAHCQGQDIKALVEELKKKARRPAPPKPVASGGLSLSDLGNARRLVAQHGQDLRYNFLAKKWLYWTGNHWCIDNCGETERRAKLTVAKIYEEAAGAVELDDRKRLAQWGLRSEGSQRLLSMVRLAQSEPGIPVLPGQLDANPWRLNCQNGTIDLTTGELGPHVREDLITRLVPCDYDPAAECEQWEQFLDRIQAKNWGVIWFLQRALGYALTGSTREQCLFILWGSGANGKSTLLNQVREILGNYAVHTPTETLLAKQRSGEIPTDVARLDGPRFVTASEIDRGRRLAESLIKELTGRDTVSARFLYGEYFDFVPQFKLFLSTNNKPVIKGVDNAIWRRINLVAFPVQIPEGERDRDLPEKLREEAPGILAWLVRGCMDWYRGGLGTPPEVLQATADYRAEMDMLAEFLEEKCLVKPNLSATAKELYEEYCSWAEANGLKDREVMKQRTFGIHLAERGFRKDKGTSGQRLWCGLGLRLIQ
jgi:putative DNA primase/helicase